MIGRKLSHYEVLEKIGSGGMGEVYLAEDTKLDRKVALKVLPPELAESEDRRARSTREAKAIAALNHPNIVTVYSVEEAEGVHFITMELVKGKTLAELLPKHGFPLKTFFDVAIPLTDAVAAAHQEDITHRDLKPDNVMLGDDGRVKVLDFGLAKPVGGFAGAEGPTAAKTREGVIVGTLNYMSPEQAEGKQVDHRSDIFSLGTVFYEMLTGQKPFQGESATGTLSAILKDEPVPVTERNSSIPRTLSKIVQRCLAKELLGRYQSVVDLRHDLLETKQDIDSGEAEGLVTASRPAPRWRWLVTGAVLAIAGAAVIDWLSSDAADVLPRLTNPVQITSATGVEDLPTWSPDGRTIAYSAMGSDEGGNGDIWVKQVERGQPVTRTADYTGRDCCPSWSPDGNEIAFWSERDGGGYFVMSAVGGRARKVLSTPVSSLSRSSVFNAPQWSADGEELAGLVADSEDVFIDIFSVRTQRTRRLTAAGTGGVRIHLTWSPDGRFFAVVDGAYFRDTIPLWLFRDGDGGSFAVTDGTTRVLSPRFSRDGQYLYFVSNREGSMDLWRQRLASDGEPEGPAQPVTVGVGMRSAAFSPDGSRLAYSKGRRVANVWRVPILEARPATWADAEQLTFDQAFLEFFDVSADGDRLLFNSDRSGNMDLWMMPIASGEMIQLTSGSELDWHPRWSPDGSEVAFYSYRTDRRKIFMMPLDGGPPVQITSGESDRNFYPNWSPDGKEIAFTANGETSGTNNVSG